MGIMFMRDAAMGQPAVPGRTKQFAKKIRTIKARKSILFYKKISVC